MKIKTRVPDNYLGFGALNLEPTTLVSLIVTSLEMESFSNITSRKRQRSSPTERTATLLDLDVTDCPICFDPLTIPIFQCDNGHIACSTCCQTLNKKCATCSLPTLSRNRAMERVLEVLRVPCPNPGCSETLPFVKTSTHVKNHCPFTLRTCPFTSCGFTCAFKDLYQHCVDAKHCESSRVFECGTPVFIYPLSGKRAILKEKTNDGGGGEGEVVVVECFDTPQGRLFYACCIGPGTGLYSYELKMYSVSGDRCFFESKLKRVCEVSDEPPRKHVMLVHASMCTDYMFYICIKREERY